MEQRPVQPTGILALDVANGITLFVGRGLVTAPHRHYTASVTWGLDGPLTVHTHDASRSETAQVGCMLAGPDAAHALDTGEVTVANLQVDPESDRFTQLAPLGLRETPLQLLSIEAVRSLNSELVPLLLPTLSISVSAVWEIVLRHLGGGAVVPRRFDARVARTLRTLKQEFPSFSKVAALAAAVGLSEGRLIRVFSAEVGVPLRRYMLWLRLRHVLFCLGAGANFTDAAHAAGFADSSHLTRVFREMFGLAPSQLLKSQNVALHIAVPQGELSGPHAASDAVRVRGLAPALRSVLPSR